MEISQKIKNLFKDALRLGSAQILGVVIGLGTSIIISRKLGADGRGVYAWISAIFFIAIPFVQLGVDTVYRRVSAESKNSSHVFAGNSVLQAMTLGVFGVIATYTWSISQPIGSEYKMAVFLSAISIPLYLLNSLFLSIIAGHEENKTLSIAALIPRLVMFFGVVLLVFTGMTIIQLFAVYSFSRLISALYAAVKLKSYVNFPWPASFASLWGIRHLVVVSFFSAVCWQLLQRIDILFLGHWRSAAELGNYSVAQSIIEAMLIFPGTLGVLLLSKLASQADQKESRAFLMSSLGFAIVTCVLMCIVAYFVAPWIIPFLFGVEFISAVGLFQLYLVAAVFMAGYHICQNAVAGNARARYIFLAPLFGLVVKVALAVILIPEHGAYGAVTTTICAYVAAFVTALIISLKSAAVK